MGFPGINDIRDPDDTRGISDTGVGGAYSDSTSRAGGNAERGTAPTISPDLQTALNNLRRCEAYTIFLRDSWKYRDTYIDNPRPTGPPIRVDSARYTEQDRETRKLLHEVYQSENGASRYSEDKAKLATFLTSTAQTIGLASLERRRSVTEGIRQRYKTNNWDDMESLTDACARMLVFRTGMPLPFTIERQMDGQVPLIGELAVSDTENTGNTLEAISRAETEPTVSPADYEPTPTELWARGRGGTTPDKVREQARERHIQTKMWHARWGNWSDDPNDRNTPFDLRLESIFYHYGIKGAEYHRKAIYLEHPITAILHFYITPYDLADILRLGSATRRNAKLEILVQTITRALDDSTDSIKEALGGGNPAHIDWSQYKPLLQAAAAFVLHGPNDQLNSICEVLYKQVDPWTWPDLFSAGMMAVGIISICIFPFASPAVALLLGAANLAMTFPGIVLAIQQIDAAYEGIRQETLDDQYMAISGDLEIIENQHSLGGAYAGLFLEILGALPWGKIVKMSRGSLGLADETVEVVARGLPDEVAHIDPVRMTPEAPSTTSAVAHPDAPYQPKIELQGPSATYPRASYAPHIDLPRITPGERLPTADEMSDFLIAKKQHDITQGRNLPMPPSDDVLRAQARRIRNAEDEMVDALDDLDRIDPPTDSHQIPRHQEYLQAKVRNEETIGLMRGVEMDADGRILGATSDLPEEVVELAASGAQFKVHPTSGNLHYKVEGQGWQHVFDELRNPPSNRALAGYSNYQRTSAWYEDLRSLWEMRGYARQTDHGWEMLDPELKLWIPESHIQMGHIVSAVEHDQMMLRFVRRAQAGEILDQAGLPYTAARIQEIRRNAVRTFMGDFMNYVPQYKWRNEALGRRIGLRYGRLDPDYVLGSSSRFKILDDGTTAPIWHGDGKSILSWSEDGMQRILTDENGVQRVINTNISPDHLAGKDMEAYTEEIAAIIEALTQ